MASQAPVNIVTFLLDLVVDPTLVAPINDTSQNIIANLNTLLNNTGSIASITSTNGTVTVGTSVFSADRSVLDKIVGGFGISDTVQNITTNLAALTADAHIVQIAGTNGTVAVTAQAFSANQAGLDKITAGFIVADSAANISANLDRLAADGLLLSISVTDNAPIQVDVGRLTSDAAAIGKLHNVNGTGYSLAVSDTAANVGQGFDRLNDSHVASVTVTDNADVPLTVAQEVGDGAARAKLVNANGSPIHIAIVDTVAAVAAGDASLQPDAAIRSITLTGGGSAADAGSFALASAQRLDLGSSTLVLNGSADLTSTMTATPLITAGAGGTLLTAGSTTIGNLVLGGGAVLRNTGTIVQSGDVQIGDDSGTLTRIANNPGGVYDIVGDGSLLVGANTGSNFNNNGGTLAKLSGTGTSYVRASFQNGSAAPASIVIASGTLQFVGAVNQFVNQAISGAGSFIIGGTGTALISGGTTITTANFQIARFGTTVTIAENLNYAGHYTQINATKLTLANAIVRQTGDATFETGPGGVPVINGAGSYVVFHTTDVAGLVIGGTTLFRNNGTLLQHGTVQVGDYTGATAQLTNGFGGTYAIQDDSSITLGASAASIINNGGGTIIKSGGTGTSVIAPDIENLNTVAGTIEAGHGTLELGGAVSGLQNLKADAGATLILDKGSSAGVNFAFNGAGAVLQLGDASHFGGVIAGFGAGESVDLRSIASGSGATASLQFTANGSGGLLGVSDGAHAATLAFAGTYTAQNFHVAADGHGGTVISFV